MALMYTFFCPDNEVEAGDHTPSYPDMGMAGHFEGFGGFKKEASTEVEAP